MSRERVRWRIDRSIERGSLVEYLDAYGAIHKGVAASSVYQGRDFPVIQICAPTGASYMVWPADSVRALPSKGAV